MNDDWKALLERAENLFEEFVDSQVEAALDEEKNRLEEAMGFIKGDETRRLVSDGVSLARNYLNVLKGIK